MKIAVLGGGSSYTPELVEGLLAGALAVDEVWLVDVPEGREKVQTVAALSRRMADRRERRVRFVVSEDRREALRGSSYVLSQMRVGGLAMRGLDERIPLRHGLLGQETTGAGGFACALRTIPVTLDIAREMDEVAPDAWLLNFTNPAGLVTQALHAEGFERAIGLCNLARITERAVARASGADPGSVHLEAAGLNHLTGSWVTVRGQDVTGAILASGAVEQDLEGIAPHCPVPPDFFPSLGFLPNHYLGYFFFRGETARHAAALADAPEGTRAQQVAAIEAELFRRYRDPALAEKPPELAQRGGACYSEVAVDVLAAMEGEREVELVLNVPNRGALHGFADDDVVERNALVGPRGVRSVPRREPLPRLLLGIAQAVKEYERLTVEAARRGSRSRAREALLSHPLIGDAQVSEALLDDLAAANRDFWPALR